MENLVFSLQSTLPVFLVMVVGYLLGKKGFLPQEFCTVANHLVFKVTLPAMLFCDMAGVDLAKDFEPRFVLFCAGATTAAILGVWAFAKAALRDKTLVGEFVQASYRSSAAILGVAFIVNMYGSSGLAPVMILGSVPIFNVFAVAVLILENPSRPAQSPWASAVQVVKGIATNPIILAILAGTVFSALPVSLPTLAQKTLGSLGGLTTPLALLSIGATFEGAKALKKLGPTLLAAAFKLVVLVAVFLPMALALGFRNQQLIALLVMLGSPTTPTSYVMAKSMGHEGVLSASCVAATTLLSALTLTAWIFLLKSGGYIG
ncbi:MAG: AEC family transporter [Gemmiger sp.]|nr:AEC family transporter [Gemmiger sp.]